MAVYFAFTSLSTVGLGDLHPRNDIERPIGALVLFFGVAIFSMYMGQIIEMLNKFISFNEDLEEGD